MLTGIGIGIGFGRSVAAEERKARSIPVPGAVVIAPLTQSWRNYGSAGGEFTLLGSPTISASGALFGNGGNSGAYIPVGTVGDFTLTLSGNFVARTTADVFGVGLSAASGLNGWTLVKQVSDANKVLLNIFSTSAQTSVNSDLADHIWTLRRTGTTLIVRRDGVQVLSTAIGTAGGTLLALGAVRAGGAWYYTRFLGKNVAYFAVSKTDEECASVEVWAAA